jgi:uncharacterized membrane protein
MRAWLANTLYRDGGFVGPFWWFMVIGATLIGIFSMRYDLPSPPMIVREIKNNVLLPHYLATHATSASIALMIGPWQLLPSLRARHPNIHRWLGRLYVANVLVASLFAVWLLPTVATGFFAASAFCLAGTLWITYVVLGILAIRRQQMRAHRRWMLRSFGMAFTAVTIRFYLFPAKALGIPFEYKYPVSIWLAVLTNILFIELLLFQQQARMRDHKVPS